MTRTVFRTTLPDVPLPTADDLQPLYDAALDYGKASVATSRKYTELKDGQYGGNFRAASRDPALVPLSRRQDELYQTMTDVRQTINDRFPGLDLSCPAPFVGWHAEMDGYRNYVAHSLRDYVNSHWSRANEPAIRAARELLPRKTTQRFAPDMFVYGREKAYRVVRVTHHGKRVHAANILDERDTAVLRPTDNYRRISLKLVKMLVKLHVSRIETFNRYGIDLSIP